MKERICKACGIDNQTKAEECWICGTKLD